MKRILCIRFPNWPIQCRQYQLRSANALSTALALHSPAPSSVEAGRQKSAPDEDTRYFRALFPASLTGPAIVAVSADAWSRGVRPGMPLAEARSMAQPVTPAPGRSRSSRLPPSPVETAVDFYEWQPHQNRQLLKETAELTRRYAPLVGLDVAPMPDSLLLDITGCGPLFGGEAGLAELLLKDLRKAGWSCRIAVAQSVSAVWALTHADISKALETAVARDRRRPHRSPAESVLHELPIQIVPAGQHLSEINRLPVSASRLALNDLEILKHLGIRTIGQLLGLPREDLPSRLSTLGVLRIQQLLDVVDEPIESLPEANPVAANWSSDDPACGLQDIRHILQHLIEQIVEQLLRRRMACGSISCEFQCVDGSVVPLTASVVKPTQSSELLHEILCMRIETETTLSSMEVNVPGDTHPAGNIGRTDVETNRAAMRGRIASLDFQPFCRVSMIAAVSPIPTAKQRDLFSPAEHIVPQEELATLITRLSGRLGSDAVLKVRTHPDPRPEFSVVAEPVVSQEGASVRQSQLDTILGKFTEPLNCTIPETTSVQSRPLRLLSVPQPIARTEGDWNFPKQLMLAGKVYDLLKFSTPERIQTAWWTEQPCHRDYYEVTSRSGSRFWLFRDLQTSQWYLHGVFD